MASESVTLKNEFLYPHHTTQYDCTVPHINLRDDDGGGGVVVVVVVQLKHK